MANSKATIRLKKGDRAKEVAKKRLGECFSGKRYNENEIKVFKGNFSHVCNKCIIGWIQK